MPEKEKPKKPKRIGDEIVSGVTELTTPGYAAYRREAEAMGEEVLTPEQWSAKKKREE
jgi:hypothetical protein